MPFYRFDIQSPLTVQTVLTRLRGLVREKPGFVQALKEAFGERPENAPPFIGTVEGDTFKMYRNIRYQNSFLPRIRGRVEAASGGTRIHVVMTPADPGTAIFVSFCLGVVLYSGISSMMRYTSPADLVPLGLFAFGLAITLGGFFPEVIKARRLLEQALGNTGG